MNSLIILNSVSGYIAGVVIAGLLLVFLAVTLFKPEKF